MCRLNNPGLLKLLLSEKNRTFMEAVEIAQASKAVKNGSKLLHSDDMLFGHIASTVPIREKTSTGSIKPSKRRGDSDHTADKCHFKQLVCHKCRKLGNIAQVCQSKKAPVVLKPPKSNQESGEQEKVRLCYRSKFWISQFWSNYYLKMEHFLCSQCTARPGNQSRLLSR